MIAAMFKARTADQTWKNKGWKRFLNILDLYESRQLLHGYGNQDERQVHNIYSLKLKGYMYIHVCLIVVLVLMQIPYIHSIRNDKTCYFSRHPWSEEVSLVDFKIYISQWPDRMLVYFWPPPPPPPPPKTFDRI